MIGTASTVDGYLQELPTDRAAVLRPVIDIVRSYIQEGFDEHMGFGMICWTVPLARYPATYNGQPLAFVSLAAQKKHYALYLMCAYGDGPPRHRLAQAFAAAGKTLDMGTACLRFTSLEAVPWPAVGEVISQFSVDGWIEHVEAAKATPRVAPVNKAPAKKGPAKKR